MLVFCEWLYRILFYIIKLIKKNKIPTRAFCPVISVGNISVGGTGKSVMVLFLLKLLASKRVAVIASGYNRKKKEPCLVSNGKKILENIDLSGDEPFMIATMSSAVVAVSKNRSLALSLIKKNDEDLGRQTKIIILDDAYQNYNLFKDIEIVLIDALRPFGNGHCLPAGPLREKDLSRATFIIVTRSEDITFQKKEQLEKLVRAHGGLAPIFYTYHAVAAIYKNNTGIDVKNLVVGVRCLIVAGIGNFDAFVVQAKKIGCIIASVIEYEDHHVYDENDLQLIDTYIKNYSAVIVLTTAKDWNKISCLDVGIIQAPFYVVHVGIEFLSTQEYHDFLGRLDRALNGLVRAS